MASMLERHALDAMIVARCRRSLGHEMKNAVQGLYSGIEILNKAIESQGKARIGPADCVPLLRRQLEGLQETLHRILDDVAPQPGEPGAVDIAALARDLVRFLMSDAAVAGVRIETDVPQSLSIWARTHVVRQVLLGFVLDAIDAMRGGGALQLRVEEDDGVVKVELADSRSAEGTALVSSEHERIDTELLRRIAAELVAEERGTLSIEPLARGCSIRITLPRAQ
jgi:signal transduction histidine kinase